MTNYHLAILKKPYLEAILDGSKTVESRFTKTRRAPYGQVHPGDRLFLKQSSGPVCAAATVSAVKTYANLTPKEISDIKRRYNRYIAGDGQYWKGRADCNFGSLFWIKDVRTIEPVRIIKKDWRAWVVLTDKENFGLNKSVYMELGR